MLSGLPGLMTKLEKTQIREATRRNARSQSPASQGRDHLSVLCLYRTEFSGVFVKRLKKQHRLLVEGGLDAVLLEY